MIQVAPEKVRQARLAAGIRTIQAASREAGLNYKTVEAYEGHKGAEPPASPSLEALLQLAKAYKCNPRDFAVDPSAWDEFAAAISPMITPPAQASI